MGPVLGALGFAIAFGLVWHIWWLVILAALGSDRNDDRVQLCARHHETHYSRGQSRAQETATGWGPSRATTAITRDR